MQKSYRLLQGHYVTLEAYNLTGNEMQRLIVHIYTGSSKCLLRSATGLWRRRRAARRQGKWTMRVAHVSNTPTIISLQGVCVCVCVCVL